MQEEQIRQNKSYGQVGSGERRDSGSVPAATESTQSMIEARYHCEIRLFLLCLGGSMMCRMKNKFWTGASAVLSYHRAPLANCAAGEADRLHEIQARRSVYNARADCNLREELPCRSLAFCRHPCRGVWQGQRSPGREN